MIPIPIVDGLGYIYDVELVKLLREKYHIAGVLSGVLPQFPQQTIFGGIPLQLLPEDLQLLLETGDFYLTEGTTSASSSSLKAGGTPNSDSVKQPPQSEVVYKRPSQEGYQVYKYLMNRGYYMMPGLRFGCQYMAYPGDLMRYHSHYNVLGFGWNEAFDVMDIVNGGRLATSVKKCWVVGAEDPEENETRVFSIEWAGFG